MPVNDFEKQVQQKMDELKFAPSTEVWTEVEKRIRKEKKRRRIIFWWLIPGLLLGGAVVYFLNNNREEKTIAKQEQGQQIQKEETGSLIQPQTNVTTTDNAAGENITQSIGVTDKKKADEVLPKKDQPGYNQNANSEISVSNAATKKKAKAKQSDTMKEFVAEENQQVLVVDPVTKKKEQEQSVTTTELSEVVNEKPTVKKDVAVKTKDSIVSIAKEETKNVEEPKIVTEENPVSATKKNKKKWDVGFGIQGGSSNTIVGRLFGGMMFFDASPYNTPGAGQSTGGPVYLSTPRNGFSKGIEFFVQKNISKKLDFRAAVQYNYLSTHIKTGSRVDSTRQINNSLSDGLRIDNFYRPATGVAADHPYTNRYHMAGLSATLSWKIISGKKFSLHWDNNITFNQLLSTNALHYDRDLRAYYTDFKPFRKTQLFIGTGLSVPLIRKENFTMMLNPFAQVGLRPVLKKSDGQDSRFVNAGFALKFLFPHKK